jgi:hypothetical protein
MTSQSTRCPACGYSLGFAPWTEGSPSDEICPSCGIQYGYDDAAGGRADARAAVYRAWRETWVRKGCPWSSAGTSAPADWNPREQVRRAGFPLDDDSEA